MTHGSLFNGIGGFQLAAYWMGWENIFHCEIDQFCNKVVKQHFPESICYEDITDTDFTLWAGRIGILSGGFPCQDISESGKGAGITGQKSGLWSHFFRAIDEIRPGYALIENSHNLTRKGLEKVLYDLSEIRYNAEWTDIRASDIGACHKRARLFILAYPTSQRRQGILYHIKKCIIEKNKSRYSLDSSCSPFLQFEQSIGEPAVFGVADGVSKRLDVVNRLGAAGNAVMPQIAYEIFKAIELFEKVV
jgi:DNA (cytosine-5)-methyltransferase 1